MSNNKTSSCICFNIRHASNVITNYYNKILEDSGITLNQYAILNKLNKIGKGVSTTALSENMRINRSTLVRNLKPLEEKGFIENNSKSKRDNAIFLTEKGKEVLNMAKPMWKKAQEVSLKTIGEENLRNLNEIIKKIEEL